MKLSRKGKGFLPQHLQDPGSMILSMSPRTVGFSDFPNEILGRFEEDSECGKAIPFIKSGQ